MHPGLIQMPPLPGFNYDGFAFIPAHGPKSQDFNCGVILQGLPAPFEPNSSYFAVPALMLTCDFSCENHRAVSEL